MGKRPKRKTQNKKEKQEKQVVSGQEAPLIMEENDGKTQNKKEKQEKQVVSGQEAPLIMEENDEMWIQKKIGELIASGMKFYPTDEELILYLKNKILNTPFPVIHLRSVDLYKFTPQQLTEMHIDNGDKDWYFYAPRYREYAKENRTIRMAIDGYWKIVGSRKIIYNEGQKVGFKRALIFHGDGARHGEAEFKWRMDEYILDQKRVPSTIQDPDDTEFNDWVLCKIYQTTADVKINQPKDKKEPNPQSNEEDTMANIIFDLVNCLGLLHSVFGPHLHLIQEQTGKNEPGPSEKRS